uniref:ZP domain-containing protein n=1 Tax=Globodera pallida TaxID=36090 RepID=A0A183CGX7_GLOPA
MFQSPLALQLNPETRPLTATNSTLDQKSTVCTAPNWPRYQEAEPCATIRNRIVERHPNGLWTRIALLRVYWPLFTLLGMLNVAQSGIPIPDQMVMEATCDWDLLDFGGHGIQLATDLKVGLSLSPSNKNGYKMNVKQRRSNANVA